MVGIVLEELSGIAGRTQCTGLVAGLFKTCKHAEVNVEHIVLWPYGTTVVSVILVVVAAVGCQLQRNEVFVVVVLVVATHSHEDSQLVVAQRRVVDEVVGMHIHLQMTILAKIQRSVAIDALRLALRQVLHHHAQCLLVGLRQLRLRGVCDTGDAWRQHVVDRFLVVVLLDVDGTNLQRTAVQPVGERLLIDAPFATHQVQAAEAQHDGLAELGEEHTHETDAGEVADATHTVFRLVEGYAELVPAHGFLLAVAQRSRIFPDVGNEVMAQPHVLRTDADVILIVALILVQRIVLVDVLHVRIGLVAGVVALRLLFAVRRVALRHVDALVAIEDGGLGLVVVRAAEVVVVVVGRVVVPGSTQAVVDVQIIQEGGVGRMRTLLGIVHTVQAYVLQAARAAGSGKGVGLRGLHGDAAPLGGGVRRGAVNGHTALIELLAVAQDVLADLT